MRPWLLPKEAIVSTTSATQSPSGVVTFLFTDVQGSTKLWEQHPQDMTSALADHDAILRSSIAEADGVVFSTAGDAFAAAFETPDTAIQAAAVAQHALDEHRWPGTTPIKVRMGVHTGTSHQRDNDYFGPTLNRAARLMSAAHGGQTVVSTTTQEMLPDAPLVDMGVHRLKDLSRPERVWQLMVDGLAAEFPPLRTLNAVPTNLPTDLASFVGREADISHLMTDLEKNRLVVMTGVGGVGKTRLSLQVAADASHHYTDGLWLVELAPVPIADAVHYKFLETMGLEAESGRSPLQTLAASIGNGAVLLVIDNCEHVLTTVADAVRELMTACPNLKVLASSRRALGVSGEQVRQIQPLGTTGVDCASTRLFLDRAEAAGQSALHDRLDVITHICERLDGVPLAIELAAARTRSMTPEDVASRLDERFRLLRGSRSGGGDERHQTLVSTIEWSYQLLDDDQKLLFQRVGVFAGSFTLAAAEKICADDRLDMFDVVDLLDDLVDHSLVIADTSGTTTRYRMLETIREYARQMLGDEIVGLRDRHASFHADWVDAIFLRLVTHDEAAALAELEAGWSDLRMAAAHATGDLSLLARILGPLAYDAFFRSRLELADWAAVGLDLTTDNTAHDVRAVLLALTAALSGLGGDAVRSVSAATELCELSEMTGCEISSQVSAAVIGGVVLSGDVPLCSRIQDLSERTISSASPPWAVAMSATFRAVVATYSGQAQIAKEASAKAVAASPSDMSPSFRAIAGWMAAVNSDAPRAEGVARMEAVVAQASLVRSSFLHAMFDSILASLRGEVGHLRESLTESADSLERMLSTRQLGLAPATVRRASVLLMTAGASASAATLLGWVDSNDNPTPATADVAADMDVLVPQMHAALGEAALQAAISAGALLTAEQAMTLSITELRSAVLDIPVAGPDTR
jgi:predicted ATPase/class 3 adenylate cyclase